MRSISYMRFLYGLVGCFLLLSGTVISQAQSAQTSLLIYANDEGIWQFNPISNEASLWIANESGLQFRVVASQANTFYLVDDQNMLLYVADINANTVQLVLTEIGSTVAVDPIIPPVILDDGSVIYKQASTDTWYRYIPSTDQNTIIYSGSNLEGCGINLLHSDHALLNPYRLYSGWSDGNLLIPVNCSGGIQHVLDASSQIVIPNLAGIRSNDSGLFLLGDIEGALGIFDSRDGELQLLATEFLGLYQNWWWHNDAIIFSVARPTETLDYPDYADEAQAEFFMGNSYLIDAPIQQYQTELYYWDWLRDTAPRQLVLQSNTRGIESLAVIDDTLYFTAVNSIYPLAVALQGTVVEGVNNEVVAPTFEELRPLEPRQRIFSLSLQGNISSATELGIFGQGVIAYEPTNSTP